MVAMSSRTDDLARLWEWTSDQQFHGYSPLYERIALTVAGDQATLALVSSLPPNSHLPLALFAAVHYLLLDGLDHPLAEVYAGRSDADPAPLFIEVCRTHWDEIESVLATRHVQTNDCGRSALIGPGLTWLAARLPRPPALIDVGASAGLSLLCDRYRLDYGNHGVTGPEDSTVEVRCRVVGGDPPIAERLPVLDPRIGIDRSPLDLSAPADARWLLACFWPDTGRLERTAASIRLAQADLPQLVSGDANEVLPGCPGRPARRNACGGHDDMGLRLLLDRTASPVRRDPRPRVARPPAGLAQRRGPRGGRGVGRRRSPESRRERRRSAGCDPLRRRCPDRATPGLHPGPRQLDRLAGSGPLTPQSETWQTASTLLPSGSRTKAP